MTERNEENVEIPDRAHDQPAEGGREQAEEATKEASPAEKVD